MSLRSHLHLRHSSSGRDAALERLRWINRSVIAGSVALTAIFADTAANTFAGATTGTNATRERLAKAPSTGESTETTEAPAPLAPPKEAPGQAQSEPQPESTPAQEAAPQSSESAPSSEQPAEASSGEQPGAPAESAPAESTPAPAQEEAPVVSGAS